MFYLLEQSFMFQHNDICLTVDTYPCDILSTQAGTYSSSNTPARSSVRIIHVITDHSTHPALMAAILAMTHCGELYPIMATE